MSLSYGSFGNTKVNVINIKENHFDDDQEDGDALDDNDSGMSSEETDESLKLNLSPNNNNNVSKNVSNSTIVDGKQEVITKCLTNEPQCAQHGNEIPSCSSAVNHVSVSIENDETRPYQAESKDLIIDNKVSDYIVIDLTCDVDKVRALSKGKKKKLVGTKNNIDCDYSSIPSVGSSQSLVPVVNNEIVNTENQKLLSLSLSILLAALLQAMRCFAQFLEDIVVPQR